MFKNTNTASIYYMSKSDRLNLSILETRVLWAISRQPLHGYALLKHLNSGRKREITNGTLYPILQKLLKEKTIRVKKTGNREKKIYEISKSGKAILKDACNEICATFQSIFNDFVCKTCGSRVKGKG